MLERSARCISAVAVELGRKTHRKREQSKARGECQRPHANSDLAPRAKTAADNETDNHGPGVMRSTARLGYIVGIAPEQDRADIYHQAGCRSSSLR